MSDPELRQEAVDAALTYLRQHGSQYTRDVLDASLRTDGYTDPEIAEAWKRMAGVPQTPDLRARAAAILIGVYFTTWALVSVIVESPDSGDGMRWGGLASLILGGVLLFVGFLSLIAIGASGRLRRGVEGAMVAILAIPFLLLFILAGLCVATTGNSTL